MARLRRDTPTGPRADRRRSSAATSLRGGDRHAPAVPGVVHRRAAREWPQGWAGRTCSCRSPVSLAPGSRDLSPKIPAKPRDGAGLRRANLGTVPVSGAQTYGRCRSQARKPRDRAGCRGANLGTVQGDGAQTWGGAGRWCANSGGAGPCDQPGSPRPRASRTRLRGLVRP